ncbi:hypothetical protein Pcinc_001831 [Petrolisthes cinctipes]|uniref:Uncharacterized protein n=1 Tax=Petrolisthes cinctipes TaxID=88211 RepID=A0AAE1L5R6_PETCI|nr:hypothetical protein Pcinc_001831 [Petrolisthes cinctipes]
MLSCRKWKGGQEGWACSQEGRRQSRISQPWRYKGRDEGLLLVVVVVVVVWDSLGRDRAGYSLGGVRWRELVSGASPRWSGPHLVLHPKTLNVLPRLCPPPPPVLHRLCPPTCPSSSVYPPPSSVYPPPFVCAPQRHYHQALHNSLVLQPRPT